MSIEREFDYRGKVIENLIDYLSDRYLKGESADVAALCDSKLDRSGRLLGEVREAARKKI